MNEELKELLEGEIKNEIENLQSLTPGSKEHAEAVESLAKLYKINIEGVKLEGDFAEIYEKTCIEKEKLQDEREQKAKQLVEQNKDRWVRFGVDAAQIVLPLVFYGVWMKRGFKFEESGTFTSNTFKGLIGKFKPTRK